MSHPSPHGFTAKRPSRRLGGLIGLVALALLASSGAASANDADVYVRAGRLFTGREVLEDVVVQVRDGKIVALLSGDDVQLPPGATVIDRSEHTIAPGFVLTQMGIGSGKRDSNSLSARFRALDAYDPYADHKALLARGITTAFVHPGRGRLATGEGAVVKLAGAGDERVLRARGELCLDAGKGALGAPPKTDIPFPSSSDVPIKPGTPQRPGSRASVIAELAAQLRAALRYDQARKGKDRPKLDHDLQALADAVLKGRLRIDARRSDELRGLLELMQALGLKPVLSGVTEGDRVLGPLAALGAPVIYEAPHGLSGSLRAAKPHPDALKGSWSTPSKLAQAGLRVALAPPFGAEQDLRLLAALCVRGGLSRLEALASITSRAAQVLGVSDRVGALVPGRDADFVVLSGEPLATSTDVLETWVSGERVYRSEAATRARAVVVRAGTIVTSAGPVIHNGSILIEDGQIAAIGTSVPHPRGARVIDAGPDAVITPGFVDAYGHLGMRGASSRGPSLKRAFATERADMLRLARAGVTTAVIGPPGRSSSGLPLLTIKTAASASHAEALRRKIVVETSNAVIFDLSRADPAQGLPSSFTSRLRAGVAHAKRWADYRKKVAAWEQERAKKQEAEKKEAIKRRGARVPVKAKKKEAPKAKKDDKVEGPKVKKKEDPVSGTWEFKLSFRGRSQTGTLLLKLEEDNRISGVAKPPEGSGGEDTPVVGKLTGKKIEMELKPNRRTPFKLVIKATLDAPDHMTGEVLLGGRMRLTFEADRTERSIPEIKIQVRRRSSKDGRPQPPRGDPVLDAIRKAVEGTGAIVISVRHPRVARAALAAARKLGIQRVTFMDFADADLISEELVKAGVGILLVPGTLVVRDKRSRSLAADLSARGFDLAFGSRADGGAERLPLRALLDVAEGLDPGKALAALTCDAARLLGVDERVGSLETGKDGDLLIFDGPPMEATTRLRTVIVRGRVLSPEEEK